MKSKNKAFQLIEKGLSAETVSKLSESEISTLHKKLVKEVTMVSKQDSTTIEKLKGEKKPFEVYEIEMTEDDEIEKDPFQLQSTQDKRQVGPGEYGNNPQVDKEMDDNDADGMGIMEDKKSEKNPWAICTAQLGKEFGTKERSQWSAKEMSKYERCVKDVKKSLKEGKNPISLFLENEILRIVEKHIPPKITKGDLMKHLREQGPTTAPTKPGTKEKPGVKEKPGKPTRPMRPGKNPHPGEKEAPKAKKISHDEAKDNVIQTIMKLLKK